MYAHVLRNPIPIRKDHFADGISIPYQLRGSVYEIGSGHNLLSYPLRMETPPRKAPCPGSLSVQEGICITNSGYGIRHLSRPIWAEPSAPCSKHEPDTNFVYAARHALWAKVNVHAQGLHGLEVDCAPRSVCSLHPVTRQTTGIDGEL